MRVSNVYANILTDMFLISRVCSLLLVSHFVLNVQGQLAVLYIYSAYADFL